MSKKRIITGLGVICLTIGIVGGIWSGISAMPKIMNNFRLEQAKYDEKEIIYNNTAQISNLNIDSKASNIVVKKHDKPEILIERKGNKDLSSIVAKVENNTLVIKEERKNYELLEVANINDMVKFFVERLYVGDYSDITVYLPKEINLDIKTQYNNVNIEDDIVSDNLNFTTLNGRINLNENLEFENFTLKSDADLQLYTNEVFGIKNIKIVADMVDIHTANYEPEQLETKIPETIEITANTVDENQWIRIDASVPVAKNLIINSGSIVDLNLPMLRYKFNFELNAANGIEFDNEDDGLYKNTPLEKYFNDESDDESNNIKEFSGLINNNLPAEAPEYNVKINSMKIAIQ